MKGADGGSRCDQEVDDFDGTELDGVSEGGAVGYGVSGRFEVCASLNEGACYRWFVVTCSSNQWSLLIACSAIYWSAGSKKRSCHCSRTIMVDEAVEAGLGKVGDGLTGTDWRTKAPGMGLVRE